MADPPWCSTCSVSSELRVSPFRRCAATGLRDTKLGMRLGSGLPADSEVQQAAEAASQGFAPGVLAPAIVLVEGEAVADRRDG